MHANKNTKIIINNMTQDAPLHVRAAQHFAENRRLDVLDHSDFDALVTSKLGVVSFRSGRQQAGSSIIGAEPKLHAVVELNEPVFGAKRFYVKPGRSSNIRKITDDDSLGQPVALTSFMHDENLFRHVVDALNSHAPKPAPKSKR